MAATKPIADNDTSTASVKTPAANDVLQPSINQLENWLNIQCPMIKDVISAHILRIQSNHNKLEYLAAIPQRDRRISQAASGIKHCVQHSEHIIESNIESISLEGLRIDRISYPLLIDEQQKLLLILEIDSRSEIQQRAVINMLKWGCQWLNFTRPTTPQLPAPIAQDSSHNTLSLSAKVLEHDCFASMATSLATELASELQCSRVCVGAMDGKHITVRALSHNASFDHKSNNIRAIANAMDEACEQDELIQLPVVENHTAQIQHAHKQLLSNSRNEHICTLPIAYNGRLLIAVTLERQQRGAFTQQEICVVQSALALLAPTLKLQLDNEQSILTKMRNTGRDFAHKLIGPNNAKTKLFTTIALLLIAFVSLVDGTHQVSSNASVEGSIQRVVVAPISGFLAEANVRAGDIVKKDQLMGSLDDKDLKLEQLRVASEQQQLLGEYREAMAEHNNSKVSIIGAKIDQANAQMKLLNEQLKRTQLTAPFSGVVIEGDLSQSLGAPVERGDMLFKVAPLENFRIILKVNERDIAGIENGQQGTLVLTSLPEDEFSITVEKITAVSVAEDQQNYFRVEATLAKNSELLRPGMEGVGKVALGERKLIWVWTHNLVDWLRLNIWSLVP